MILVIMSNSLQIPLFIGYWNCKTRGETEKMESGWSIHVQFKKLLSVSRKHGTLSIE